MKNLPQSTCLSYIIKEMKNIERLSPLVKAVVSPFLKESHIEEMKKVCGTITDEETAMNIVGGSLLVCEMERLEIEKIRPTIISIANKAYHEDFLVNKMKDLRNFWAKVEMPIGPMESRPEYVGTRGVVDFNEILDDALQNVGKVLSNRHVGSIQKETEEFQKNLLRVKDIVDRLALLQAKFEFLDDLFESPDLRKHLPSESSIFETSSKMLLSLFKRVESRGNAMGIWRTAQLEDHLVKVSSSFEGLEVSIRSHLSQKREQFGRLYLQSDSEMLDLIANYHKSAAVFNGYLSILFDSVGSAKITEAMGEQ